MSYLSQGFGVFLGVIAGIAVALVVQWVSEYLKRKQKLANLKFELGLNIKKIESWLEEVNRYRNAVNGDTLSQYYGYYDLSRFVYPTAQEMFLSGLLYKYLDYPDIGALQVITAEFSQGWENILNNQIAKNRESLNEPRCNTDLAFRMTTKAEIIKNVEFWERKFREHKLTLENIKQKLS